MKLIWVLLLFPFSLLAQTHPAGNEVKKDPVKTMHYIFHSLTMDDFVTTSPENGGKVIYNYDTTGMKIDGEIEINPAAKFVEIFYIADKKHPMKASVQAKALYDKKLNCFVYKGEWLDTKEKTEITFSADDSVKEIKVLFGPHRGDYANYWDRIYKYKVSRKE